MGVLNCHYLPSKVTQIMSTEEVTYIMFRHICWLPSSLRSVFMFTQEVTAAREGKGHLIGDQLKRSISVNKIPGPIPGWTFGII